MNTVTSSSIVNVAAPGHPTNGKFLTNTTTCRPVDRSSSDQSALAGLHVDLSFSTPNFGGGEAGRALFCPQSTTGSTAAAKEGSRVSLLIFKSWKPCLAKHRTYKIHPHRMIPFGMPWAVPFKKSMPSHQLSWRNTGWRTITRDWNITQRLLLL